MGKIFGLVVVTVCLGWVGQVSAQGVWQRVMDKAGQVPREQMQKVVREVQDGRTEVTGMVNPASRNCVDKGGSLEIRDEEAGQVGYCLLENGFECEEWKFFRGECDSVNQAVKPTVQSVKHTIQSEVRVRQAETREAREEAKARISRMVMSWQDQQKARVMVRIEEKLNELNQTMVANWLRHLERMGEILVKAEGKTGELALDGNQVEAVELAIENAKTSLESATEIVGIQAEMIYEPEVGDEEEARVFASQARDELMSDLKSVRIEVVAARQAVVSVVEALGGVI